MIAGDWSAGIGRHQEHWFGTAPLERGVQRSSPSDCRMAQIARVGGRSFVENFTFISTAD